MNKSILSIIHIVSSNELTDLVNLNVKIDW